MSVKALTVAELIARLQAFPADLPVYLADWNEMRVPDAPMDASDGPLIVCPCPSAC